MSRELRFIHKMVHMGGREKEDKEGAKDEEEKEDAEERAVKEDSERPSWREGVHEEEEREQALSSGIANRQGRDRPDKGRPMWTKLVSIGRSLHIQIRWRDQARIARGSWIPRYSCSGTPQPSHVCAHASTSNTI
jgi:hypothetical protein